MKDIEIRPFTRKDEEVLEWAKEHFTAAQLETPHGYVREGENVETAVAQKDNAIVASLTGTLAVVLDPFLRTQGWRGDDLLAALFKLEAVLSYRARSVGAVDAYIAIPNGVTEEERSAAEAYIRIIRRCGYEETIQNCRVFRRDLTRGNKGINSGIISKEAVGNAGESANESSHEDYSATD